MFAALPKIRGAILRNTFHLELFEPHMPHIETLTIYEMSQKVCQNDRLVLSIQTVCCTSYKKCICSEKNQNVSKHALIGFQTRFYPVSGRFYSILSHGYEFNTLFRVPKIKPKRSALLP